MAYSDLEKTKIIDEICDLISSGLSLRKAIEQSDSIPKTVFLDWIAKSDDKADQYARAMEERTELKFESIQSDYLEVPVLNPVTGAIDSAWVALQRLKIDAKKWELAKLMPKKYGDRLDLDHTTKGEAINIISLGIGVKPED
jgi:hypothetical protein